jgi:hypothetical protein
MGPRAVLDSMQKRNFFCPYQGSNPGSSLVVQAAQSVYRMSYPGSLTKRENYIKCIHCVGATNNSGM